MFLINKNKRISGKLGLFIISLFFCFLGSNVEGSLLSKSISINMEEPFPQPNKEVSFSVESSETDLNRAVITWFVNDSIMKKGLGEKTLTFFAGGLGSTDIITVQVSSINMGVLLDSLVIRPAEIDLIWEADSYTPPFYKGKGLSSSRSTMNIIAMPSFIKSNGDIINPEEIIYTWKKDWVILGSLSGYGKNVLVLDRSRNLRESLITVEAKSIDGDFFATRSARFKPSEPKIVFYKKDALLGTIYEKAITGEVNLGSEDTLLEASPFFFSFGDFNLGNLEYNWTLNYKKVNGLEKSNIINLLSNSDKEGKSFLGLRIQNKNKVLQLAEGGFFINLDKSSNSNPFGLYNNN